MQVAYPETIHRLQGGDLTRKVTPRGLKRFPLWEDANRASEAAARRTSIQEVTGTPSRPQKERRGRRRRARRA